ncbi:MAG: spermidine/putrescine ABC transporter permease PotC [Desulfovibrionaceae bacterium]
MIQWLWRFVRLAPVYLFLYLPVLVLIVFSFNDSKYTVTWHGFTWRWYQRLFENAQLMDAAVHSLTVAILAASLATVLGLLAAVALYRYRFRGKTLLSSGMYVVMVSPDIVMGVALLVLFIALGLTPGFFTLLLAHITFCLPFVAVTVFSRLQGLDRNLIEAAQDLGASEFNAFRHVILPLAWPAVLAGWLLSFTLSMDDVIISFFVTGQNFEILPLRVYSMVRLGVKPDVNALSALIIGVTVTCVFSAHILLRRKR